MDFHVHKSAASHPFCQDPIRFRPALWLAVGEPVARDSADAQSAWPRRATANRVADDARAVIVNRLNESTRTHPTRVRRV